MKIKIGLLLLICLSVGVFGCAKRSFITKEAQPLVKPSRGDNYKIGVVLPLTGRYAIYGKSTLHGVECAAGIFSPCESPIKTELVIKDDAGQPDRAASAIKELVEIDGVSVIVGPLSSAAIDAAAAEAQRLSVPIISLSQKEGITSIGEYVFSVSLTPTSQVDTVVNWAVHERKFRRFGIVYPMNTYGEIYKKLFTEKIKELKGLVVFASAYGEASSDFNELFNKESSFDAIFIPDSYRAVGYISQVLQQGDVKHVQLLGINRWNNPELIDRGGEVLEGAVFVDGFFDKSTSAGVQKFVGTFKEAYKIEPTVLEANGFDATRLVIKALQSTGGKHPQDVRNALATTSEVEGSANSIGFGPNREIIRPLFMLTIKDGQIVELGK